MISDEDVVIFILLSVNFMSATEEMTPSVNPLLSLQGGGCWR